MICTVQPSSPEILHPDESVAAADKDRLGDGGHAGRDALLHDEAWIGIRP